MKLNRIFPMLMLGLTLFTVSSCNKKSNSTPTGSDTYFPKVKDIIQANCLSCHSSTGAWTGRPTAFDTDTQIVSLAGSIKAAVADPATPLNRRMP